MSTKKSRNRPSFKLIPGGLGIDGFAPPPSHLQLAAEHGEEVYAPCPPPLPAWWADGKYLVTRPYPEWGPGDGGYDWWEASGFDPDALPF